jgi:hypothetical protein
MGPRASSAWRGVRRLCGMYKFTSNPSFGWGVNKTEVPCWEIATLFARQRTSVTAHYEHYCSWWVVHRRPVSLAKLSVPTHHLSLFRVPWRLNYFRHEYSWKIARWTLNINQSINIWCGFRTISLTMSVTWYTEYSMYVFHCEETRRLVSIFKKYWRCFYF